MTTKRVYYLLLGALLLLAAGGIAAVVYGNLLLQKKSQQLVNLKLDNRLVDEQQLSLAKAKKDIAANTELEKIAKAIVPQDKDQAKAVREIVQIAQAAGIKIKGITFPASTLGQKTLGATPTPAAGSDKQTVAIPAKLPITQAKPVEGIPGLFALEMQIQPDEATPVSYYQFLDFLNRLEHNRRTAQVSRIKIDPKDNVISFNLAVNIFIKP